MDGKKIALLVGALFVAAVTAIMAKNLLGSSAAPQATAAAIAPAQPAGAEVLVASKALPVGTILGPDSVVFQPWPKDHVDGAYYVRGKQGVDPAKMIGMVVRNEITAGQPVTQGSLVSPQDRGFLAAALTPGMRAVTISVGGASAVAGFVFPGDRVDLVLTQSVQGPSDASGRGLDASETIVSNIRVLATDQRYDNQPSQDGKVVVSPISMVTLEATPKIAEKIAVAQKLGSLSLSLRPLADAPQTQAPGAAATFTTGGEVSRFALNALPRGGAVVSGPAAPGATAATLPDGPVIRVARGNTVTVTPVGGK